LIIFLINFFPKEVFLGAFNESELPDAFLGLIRINFPFLSYLEIKVGELFTLEITLTY
jgi:hypothetical protein